MKNSILLALLVFGGVLRTAATNTLVNNKTEFESAVRIAQAGDTIKLVNGSWSNVVLEFYANGELGNPVVVTAETAGEVVLNGTSRIEIFGNYLEVHNLDFKDGATTGDAVISFRKSSSELAENCRVTNCRILNYNPSTDDVEYKWVSIFGRNNRVDHCTFTGKNHEGALLVVWLNGSANYHRIDHNYFSDIPRLDRNGAETIRIGTSTNSMTESKTVVEHNVFEKCDGELEIISNKSNFNVYRYNTFRNNDGGLTLRHGNDCEVYGNFFFGASGKSCGGVRLIGERHKVYNNYFQDLEGSSTRAAISVMNGVPNSPLNRYFQVIDAEVVHNTIVNCRQALAIGVGKSDELSLPPLNLTFANNVVDQVSQNDAISYTDNPINISYEKNYVNYANLNVSDPGIENVDPGLSLENGLWKADRSSAVVDAVATFYSYVYFDMDGQQRDDRPDVGSDEFSQGDISIQPKTAEDVGADWSAGVVSVNSLELLDIDVYAANRVLHIAKLPNANTAYNLSIYNTRGQEVLKKSLNDSEASVPVNELRGVYIIEIRSGVKGYYTKKVWF